MIRQIALKDIIISLIVILLALFGVIASINFDADLVYVLLGLSIGIPLIILTLQNLKFGLFISISIGYLIFHIGRVFPDIPTGVFLDAFVLVMFFATFLRDKEEQRANWQAMKNPISYFYLLWMAVWLFQAFNPNTTMISWLYSIRGTLITTILFYIICYHIITDIKIVKTFVKFLIITSFIVALYAFYQEFFGLLDFEKKWIFATPERYGLFHIAGKFRKWSFLAAVSDFGMFMAYSSLIILIIALKVKSWKTRAILLSIAVIEIIAMTFSGTRTAYVMIIAGVFFYALLTINQPKTIALLIVFIISLLVIYFGPFYGRNINRLRTIFEITEDASYNVREENRKGIQPYILSHPFGGGIHSTGTFGLEYNPNHRLAGFPPDNYYLQLALEKGWIGLLVTLGLFSSVLIMGVKGYFRVKNELIKGYYAAFTTGFFSLAVAGFAQLAIFQKPMGLIVICSYVILIRLRNMEKKAAFNTQENISTKTLD